MGVIFLTGCTGFIGKEVLKQFANGEEELLLLVRSPEKAFAQLSKLGLWKESRLHLLQGDLSAPKLGLSPADYARALTANVILHAGGTMDVTLGEEMAKRTFLDGAQGILDLAEQIHRSRGLRHLIHVVGYMSPIHEGNVDLEVDVRTYDSFMKGEAPYERMKFLADLLVRQQAKRLGFPLSVVNPSTVIGAHPAGVTEQTGGLGILVDAVRRNLMPAVPGGASHWVPFVANDDLARIIVHLARAEEPKSLTYNILGEKETGPNMQELLTLIAREFVLPAPKLSVPVGLLRNLMGAGLGRLTGIPAESMSFITNRSFHTEATQQLLHQMGSRSLDVRPVLPMVIADLDYRLTHPTYTDPEHFIRARKGDLAVLVREGEGNPWLIVHGLLSNSDDFLPLAKQLHEQTGHPVWLLDLPGFGRSPSLQLQNSDWFHGYVEALCQVLGDAPNQVRLVGHSFGAALAAKVAEAMPQKVERLLLLQPVLHRPPSAGLLHWLGTSRNLTKFLLKRLTVGGLTRTLLREGVFAEESEIPAGYCESVIRNLSSPRIAAANASMLQTLQSCLPELSPSELSALNVAMMWGSKDKVYALPAAVLEGNDVHVVPHGHQFPVSHPSETVKWMERQVN